jgi:tetratricopeptide (TPR) repeat protein
MHPDPDHAEGALAMGQTDSVGTDGPAFGAHYNHFDPYRIVGQSVAECRASAASEPAHNACKIIGTFHDRCFSLAQDEKLKPHGVGLSLAENRTAADALATDRCRKMAGSAHAKACAVLRNGCDGEAAFRGYPIDAIGFHDRGFACLNKRDDYDHAAADFGEVVKFNPQNGAAYNDRAAAYKLKGDFDRALVDYNQAIAIDAKYADAYNNRGTVHLARREFDLAVADFNQAIALQAVTLNGQKSTPYINLGLIYDAKGDYDEAKAQFSKAIAIDPKDEIAYAQSGIVDAKKSDYVAAIADFG